jgi:nicotinamidase-related amidase
MLVAVNRAVIVIDVQESFRQHDIWRYNSNPGIVGQVNRLVAAGRGAGDLIVWVLHTSSGSGTVFDPANGLVRLMEGLSPAPSEPMLRKTAHNAFTTTNLQQILTEQGIREVVISGIRTEQCCETTARLASDLGYGVTFVTDATATTPTPHWTAQEDRPADEIVADPRTLPVADIIARTEYALAGRFAKISSVDEFVASASSEQ